MSLNINPDPAPLNRHELKTNLSVFLISLAIAIVSGILKVYPLAILAGIPAYISFYLFFCDLLVIYKDPPYPSAHRLQKEAQREKISKALPLVLIGIPSICLILALIIFLCYN